MQKVRINISARVELERWEQIRELTVLADDALESRIRSRDGVPTTHGKRKIKGNHSVDDEPVLCSLAFSENCS